jgi:hypothetical protein
MSMFELLRAERIARTCLVDAAVAAMLADGGLFGCGSSSTPSSTETVTSSNQPPAQFLNAYSQLVSQAQQVGQQPLQQYGGATIAGFTPAQLQAFNTVDTSQGVANPYINSASEYAAASTAPIINQVQGFSPSAVSEYESPYTQQVVNATEAEFANQNAQQQTQLAGNAAAQGALGGDRLGVAQGVLAGQQQLTEAPTIAGLENQGYTTALGELNTEQQTQLGAAEANAWLNSQAGFQMGNLGNEAQSTALTGASAQLQTGALEQELAQEQLNVPYENFLQEQAYPMQETNWLAGIVEGLGSAAGGTGTSTGTTTTAAPSTASELLGLGETGLGIAALAGVLARGGRVGYDGGGPVSGLGDMEELQAYMALANQQNQARGGRTRPHVTLRDLQELDALRTLLWHRGDHARARPHRQGGGGISGFNAGTLPTIPDVAISFVPAAGAAGTAGRGPPPAPQLPGQTGPQSNPEAQGAQNIELASALKRLANPSAPTSGFSVLPDGSTVFSGSTALANEAATVPSDVEAWGDFGYRRGGGVQGFQTGGAPLSTASFSGQAQAGGLRPTTQAYLQRLVSLPAEKLTELAAQIPPNTPQGQMIQRAVQMKRMAPNQQAITTAQQTQAQPPQPNAFAPTAGFGAGQSGAGAIPAQPPMRRGGTVRGFQAGGAPSASASGTPISSGVALPGLTVQPSMSSFTAPGGETIPLLQTAGLAPGTTLSINPTSNFTAPPVSTTPVNEITYPVLSGGTGAPTFGATTTLGALGSAQPAAPSATTAAAPATAAFNSLTPSQQQYLTYYGVTPAEFATMPGATPAQQFANYQASFYGSAGGAARGGRQRATAWRAPRAGFDDGGQVDDMVLDDSGQYVPLSSLRNAPAPAGVSAAYLPPPDQAGRAPTTRPTASAAPPAGTATTNAAVPPPTATPPGTEQTGTPSWFHAETPQIKPQSGFADSWAYPVLEAGLATLAGRSPYAAVNIGQGGMQGMKAMEEQQARSDTRAEKQATVDEDADRLAELATYHGRDLDERDKQIAQQKETEQDTAGYRNKELAIEQERANTEANQGRYTYLGPSDDPNNPGAVVLNARTGKPQVLPISVGAKPSSALSPLEWKQKAWLTLHPGDNAGALAFVGGQKQMTPEEVNRVAVTLANQAYNAAINNPTGQPPGDRDAFIARETAKNVAAIRGGAAPAPGAAPGAAPAPGAGAAAPAYNEGDVLRQGNNLFKVIHGQPVYQGPAPAGQ